MSDNTDNTEDRLLAVYEMVEGLGSEVQAISDKAKISVDLVHSEAKSTFDTLVRAARDEIRKIDTTVETVLKPEIENAQKEKKAILEEARMRALLTTLVGAAAGMAFVLAGLYFFVNERGKHKDYWGQERKAVFGAKVVTSEKENVVLFDKEFTVHLCKQSYPNCVVIKLNKEAN